MQRDFAAYRGDFTKVVQRDVNVGIFPVVKLSVAVLVLDVGAFDIYKWQFI